MEVVNLHRWHIVIAEETFGPGPLRRKSNHIIESIQHAFSEPHVLHSTDDFTVLNFENAISGQGSQSDLTWRDYVHIVETGD